MSEAMAAVLGRGRSRGTGHWMRGSRRGMGAERLERERGAGTRLLAGGGTLCMSSESCTISSPAQWRSWSCWRRRPTLALSASTPLCRCGSITESTACVDSGKSVLTSGNSIVSSTCSRAECCQRQRTQHNKRRVKLARCKTQPARDGSERDTSSVMMTLFATPVHAPRGSRCTSGSALAAQPLRSTPRLPPRSRACRAPNTRPT